MPFPKSRSHKMTLPHFHIATDSSTEPSSPEAYKEGARCALALPRDIITHMRSLRMVQGECFVLVDLKGKATRYELCEALSRTVPKDCTEITLQVRVGESRQYTRTACVTLVQGISTADRMDQTIRQTTELGIQGIIPLECARSTVRLSDDTRSKKHMRWQRIAQSAAEQAACAFVPTITRPCTLAQALVHVAYYDLCLVAWEEYSDKGIRDALAEVRTHHPHNPLSSIALFVGTEGGFDAPEVTQMCDAGAVTVSLGSTVLRTETAAVVASALVLHELGALGNEGALELHG
jgi:16S rRNA (uracil1498-N3)-methyltransferase